MSEDSLNRMQFCCSNLSRLLTVNWSLHISKVEIENCECVCVKSVHTSTHGEKCKVAECWQVTALAQKKTAERERKRKAFSVFYFVLYLLCLCNAHLCCQPARLPVTKQPELLQESHWIRMGLLSNEWRTEGLTDWQTDRRDTSVVALCFGSLALHFLQSLWQLPETGQDGRMQGGS